MSSPVVNTVLPGVNRLQGKGNSAVSLDVLQGKYVLLYFSAHWCPPCRAFTPLLANFYRKHAASKNFEIVFVSLDQNEKEFNEYFAEHPWYAVPFSYRGALESIQQKSNIQTIPTLLVYSPEGQLITNNARNLVPQDPNGERFPWAGTMTQPTVGGGAMSSYLKIFLLLLALWWFFWEKFDLILSERLREQNF
eukprot:PhF_6_TR14171/c0_g1_i2/m.22677/K17609/NXN; nucleoredoxin